LATISGIQQISTKLLNSRASAGGLNFSFGVNEEKKTTIFVPQEG